MWNKTQFKKIYPDGNYTKYVFDIIKYNIKKYTVNVVKSTYLCIRFPFLYPKNRFSDNHYTNWKLEGKKSDIYTKWDNWSKGDNVQLYIDKFGEQSVLKIKDSKMVKVDYVMKLASKKDRFLYWFYGFCENLLGVFHVLPTYTELDAMPDGWRKRFGMQFCKELKHALSKLDREARRKFRITQIKEKYGDLRVYTNFSTSEIDRVINKYGYISQYVCIDCGEDAIKKTLGWISPYCEKCVSQQQQMWVWIDPIYGWSNPKYEEYNKHILDKLP